MKKAIVAFVGGIMMVACSNPSTPVDNSPKIGELFSEGGSYKMIVEAKDGVDSTRQVEFSIPANIVDSLKLSGPTLSNMCSQAALYADFYVNNERTFRFGTDKNLVYLNDDGGITAAVSGIAANAYGVEGNLNTVIEFDLKGNMLKDSDGIPVIMSF